MQRFIVWALFAAALFITFAEAGFCSDNDFECANGTCVSLDAKCDGRPDCPDASDETHALCYNHYCHPTRFRCAYGGCVDSNAPCGNFSQCFDNSDLRLLRCRNITAVVDGEFKCENGQKIQLDQLCDGEKHCEDGTDESVRACAGRRCHRGHFQCKYGGCVDANAMCDVDGRHDCADGSDEDDVLCNRPQGVVLKVESCKAPLYPDHGNLIITTGPVGTIPFPAVLSVTLIIQCDPPYRLEVPEETHCERGEWSAPMPQCKLPPPGSNLCVLPDYPTDGSYSVSGWPDARPGQGFDSVTVNVTCNAPYRLVGPEEMSCSYGHWSASRFTYCWYFCAVPRDPSVTYYCGDDLDQECGDLVPSGDHMRLKCNDGYRSTSTIFTAKCFDNGWSYVQTCVPDDIRGLSGCTDDGECNRTSTATSTSNTTESAPTPTNLCVLPAYPYRGSYSVSGWPDAHPGMTFDSVTVKVICDEPYRLVGPKEMHCSNGQWSTDIFSSCWYYCEVPRHPSVTYYCGDDYSQKCDDFVISGTLVYPRCNEYYKSNSIMLPMHCNYGHWDVIEICDLDVSVSRNGNNMTLYIGSRLVLRLSGSEYYVGVDIDSETVIDQSVTPENDILL